MTTSKDMTNQKDRDYIEKQTAEFLKKGGKIDVRPTVTHHDTKTGAGYNNDLMLTQNG